MRDPRYILGTIPKYPDFYLFFNGLVLTSQFNTTKLVRYNLPINTRKSDQFLRVEKHPVFPLDSAKKGRIVKIVDIPDGRSKAQLIRLGFVQGHLVKCLERLPGGTIVVQNNRQEVALGVSLAKSILVCEVEKIEGKN